MKHPKHEERKKEKKRQKMQKSNTGGIKRFIKGKRKKKGDVEMTEKRKGKKTTLKIRTENNIRMQRKETLFSGPQPILAEGELFSGGQAQKFGLFHRK